MSGPHDFRYEVDGVKMVADVKTGADREDPYTMEYDTIKWKLCQEFAFGASATNPRALLLAGMDVFVARPQSSADGLESLGRMRESAERRCEAFIRRFHARPSWRGMWRVLKWGFLSGWRSDRSYSYLVSFKSGEELADVVRIESD